MSDINNLEQSQRFGEEALLVLVDELGEIIKFPYTRRQLKLDNPGSSFPVRMTEKQLGELGARVVSIAERPEPEAPDFEYYVKADVPTMDPESKRFELGWVLRQYTLQELQNRLPKIITERGRAKFWKDIPFNGKQLAFRNGDDREALRDQFTAAQVGALEAIDYTDGSSDEGEQLDLSAFVTALTDAFKEKSQLRRAEDALKRQISEAESVEQVKQLMASSDFAN